MAVTYKYNAKTHSVDGYLLPTDGNMDKEVPRKPMPVLVPFVDWKDGEDVTGKFKEQLQHRWSGTQIWGDCDENLYRSVNDLFRRIVAIPIQEQPVKSKNMKWEEHYINTANPSVKCDSLSILPINLIKIKK